MRLAVVVTLAKALSSTRRWDSKPHLSRELQRTLSDCPTADEACEVLYERVDEANEVNVAATLHRASRDGCGGGSRAALFVACAEAAPRMRPRQLANSARALAVMKRPRSGDEGARRGALAAVFAGIAGERDWRSGHEAAMAAWACGSSVVAARGDEPFFDTAGAAAVALAGAAAPRLDRYGPKEAADVLWGLGAARRALPFDGDDDAGGALAATTALLDAVADRCDGLRPRDVAACAWACARLGEAEWRAQASSRAALRALATKVDAAFPPRDAAQTVAAFASAGVDAPAVVDAALGAAARGTARWALRDVADVLWAAARLDRPPAADLLRALLTAPAVLDAARRPEPSPGDRSSLISAAWAAACVAHVSAAHAAAAADALAAVAPALAADAVGDDRGGGDDDAGARPTARRQRLRAFYHARLALSAAGASTDAADAAAPPALAAAARREWRRRPSAPSARHEAVARVLDGMREQFGVVSSTSDEYGGLAVDILVSLPDGRRLAVEVDGPSHFCAPGPDGADGGDPSKRPLGHTRLKQRLLRRRGLEPVSLPYFEWDRIPHWSSMERQRYLQRKLEIREKLEYEGGDSSAFAPLPDGDDDGDSDLARLS